MPTTLWHMVDIESSLAWTQLSPAGDVIDHLAMWGGEGASALTAAAIAAGGELCVVGYFPGELELGGASLAGADEDALLMRLRR